MEEAIALHRWEEVTGTLLGLEKDDQWLSVKLREGSLIFPLDSFEAKIIEEKLREAAVGQAVGILRTDLADRPIAVRVLEESART